MEILDTWYYTQSEHKNFNSESYPTIQRHISPAGEFPSWLWLLSIFSIQYSSYKFRNSDLVSSHSLRQQVFFGTKRANSTPKLLRNLEKWSGEENEAFFMTITPKLTYKKLHVPTPLSRIYTIPLMIQVAYI